MSASQNVLTEKKKTSRRQLDEGAEVPDFNEPASHFRFCPTTTFAGVAAGDAPLEVGLVAAGARGLGKRAMSSIPGLHRKQKRRWAARGSSCIGDVWTSPVPPSIRLRDLDTFF